MAKRAKTLTERARTAHLAATRDYENKLSEITDAFGQDVGDRPSRD